MNVEVSRRSMITVVSLLGLAPLREAWAAEPQAHEPPDLAHFPRQHLELVREVVGASHRSLERVRELVSQHPPLAKSAWDWGFGDWESALGAASHVGNRAIALYLIEQGARPDIFAFAMLGHVAAVKAMVEAQPGVQRIPGPHGISLLNHAKAGGDAATGVVEYLESLKDAGLQPESVPLTAEEMAAYAGRYQVDAVAAVSFEIKPGRLRLSLERSPQPPSGLLSLGKHEFAPVGAPHVRLTFDMGQDGKAIGLTIRDHDMVVVATRRG